MTHNLKRFTTEPLVAHLVFELPLSDVSNLEDALSNLSGCQIELLSRLMISAYRTNFGKMRKDHSDRRDREDFFQC